VIQKAYNWTRAFIRDNGTKVIGYTQLTLGVFATSVDVFGPRTMKGIILASGLITAIRGHMSTKNQPGP